MFNHKKFLRFSPSVKGGLLYYNETNKILCMKTAHTFQGIFGRAYIYYDYNIGDKVITPEGIKTVREISNTCQGNIAFDMLYMEEDLVKKQKDTYCYCYVRYQLLPVEIIPKI